MKCKSWSSKINNFVVRRLKSIKINDQQQQHSQQSPITTSSNTAQQQQQQQQQQQHQQHQQSQQQAYLSNCCSNMPAMPKEKATAVSLNESNFSELKFKELATSATVAAAATAASAAAMSTTVTVTTTDGRLPVTTPPTANNNNTNSSNSITQQQHNLATTRQQSLCGCGNASATTDSSMHHKYISNGHSSPLTEAMNAQSSSTVNAVINTPQRNSNTCCRQRYNNQSNGLAEFTSTTTTTVVAAAAVTSSSSVSNADCPNLNPLNSATTIALSSSSSPSSSSSSSAITPPKKSPKDFIFGKYIGEGSFSMVYLAVDINTRREYAIKVCEKRQILREHKQEYIRREREVMHMMTNVPGFVNLSCTFQDIRSLYFVMTYAKNGDLLPYINKVGSFDIDCTRHYAAELVLACEQMHRRNVVHRDLKPENILLDEDMHSLIADFGSAKIMTAEERTAANSFLLAGGIDLTKQLRSQSGSSDGGGDGEFIEEDEDEVDSTGSSNDTTSGDDVDSPRSRHYLPRYHRKRKGSFVGTAQYVSPEVLQNASITPAADLWALGCIIYQMMSGLPPFRGNNDYVIFKEIIACNLDFPQGFDKEAEDLVKKLLRSNPAERLGAQDVRGHYESIRNHSFFQGVNFETVRQQTPPPISPYLPDLNKEEEFRVYEHLEPGLDDKQLTRLLGMELGCVSDDDLEKTKKTVNNAINKVSNHRPDTAITQQNRSRASSKNSFDLSDSEKFKRLEQQKLDKWHPFADGEVILKKGFVNKRKGLFPRRRMVLLTTGPRLIYIDPVQMIKKGEIPWTPELRVEAKNFKIFFVHTPNRTYYLDDPEGYSLEWVAAIDKMHSLTYKEKNNIITEMTTMPTTLVPDDNSSSKFLNNGKNSITITTTTTMPVTKTLSAISTATLHKTSSLLATPFTVMKTASN